MVVSIAAKRLVGVYYAYLYTPEYSSLFTEPLRDFPSAKNDKQFNKAQFRILFLINPAGPERMRLLSPRANRRPHSLPAVVLRCRIE